MHGVSLFDRVGILSQGRLVEEGTLDDLRHLSQHIVQATFAGEPPSIDLPGVTVEQAGPATLHFSVRGSVGPLVDALSGTGVVSMVSREPSLEELFLAHYNRGPEHG